MNETGLSAINFASAGSPMTGCALPQGDHQVAPVMRPQPFVEIRVDPWANSGSGFREAGRIGRIGWIAWPR